MKIITNEYFELIRDNVFASRGVAKFGAVKLSQRNQCQNRSALIFALEIVLDQYREKYKTLWSPLQGRKALELLLVQKYKWPLSEVRALSLSDSIFLLQEELVPNKLPDEAIALLVFHDALYSQDEYPDILEGEWIPDLHLTPEPQQQNW